MKIKINIVMLLALGLYLTVPSARSEETSIKPQLGDLKTAKDEFDKLDKQIKDEKNQPSADAKKAADANDAAQKYKADQDAKVKEAEKAAQDAVGKGKDAMKTADENKTKAANDKKEGDGISKDAKAAADKATQGVKNGPGYMELLEKRRKAREAIRKAIDALNAILNNPKVTLVAGQKDAAQTAISGAESAISPVAKPETKKETKKETKQGKTGAMLPPRETGTALAALTKAGMVTCAIVGKGETNGHIADAELANQTDEPQTFQLGPFVLVSKSRKGQDYGCPGVQTVDMKPHEMIRVPLLGWCLVREKPPVGNGITEELLPEDAEGSVIYPPGTPAEQGEPQNRPYSGQDVHTLIGRLLLIQQACEIVEKNSDHKGNPYPGEKGKAMRIKSNLQHTIWGDGKVLKITGGKPETEEDFNKSILDKAKVANQGKDLAEKQSKDIEQGSKNLWGEIDDTKKAVNKLDTAAAPKRVPPPSTTNVSDEREGVPGAQGTPPQTQTAPGQPAGTPPEQQPQQPKPSKDEAKPREEPKTTIEKKNDGSTIAKFPSGDIIEKDGKGKTTVKCENGYTVEFDKNAEQTTVTTPKGDKIAVDKEKKYTITLNGKKPEVWSPPIDNLDGENHDTGPIHIHLPLSADGNWGVITLPDKTHITLNASGKVSFGGGVPFLPHTDITPEGGIHGSTGRTLFDEKPNGEMTETAVGFGPPPPGTVVGPVVTKPTIVGEPPFHSIAGDLFPKDEADKKAQEEADKKAKGAVKP